jgi:hypothetical protein
MGHGLECLVMRQIQCQRLRSWGFNGASYCDDSAIVTIARLRIALVRSTRLRRLHKPPVAALSGRKSRKIFVEYHLERIGLLELL